MGLTVKEILALALRLAGDHAPERVRRDPLQRVRDHVFATTDADIGHDAEFERASTAYQRGRRRFGRSWTLSDAEDVEVINDCLIGAAYRERERTCAHPGCTSRGGATFLYCHRHELEGLDR